MSDLRIKYTPNLLDGVELNEIDKQLLWDYVGEYDKTAYSSANLKYIITHIEIQNDLILN